MTVLTLLGNFCFAVCAGLGLACAFLSPKFSMLYRTYKSNKMLNFSMWLGCGALVNCWLWALSLFFWPDPAMIIPAWAWAAFAGALMPFYLKTLMELRRDPYEEHEEDARQAMRNTEMTLAKILLDKLNGDLDKMAEKNQEPEQEPKQ